MPCDVLTYTSALCLRLGPRAEADELMYFSSSSTLIPAFSPCALDSTAVATAAAADAPMPGNFFRSRAWLALLRIRSTTGTAATAASSRRASARLFSASPKAVTRTCTKAAASAVSLLSTPSLSVKMTNATCASWREPPRSPQKPTVCDRWKMAVAYWTDSAP